jgi:Leucine-rich repeat (LRR) protein
LSHNKISVLPNNIFHLLPNINKIILDYNIISQIPVIDDLKNAVNQSNILSD